MTLTFNLDLYTLKVTWYILTSSALAAGQIITKFLHKVDDLMTFVAYCIFIDLGCTRYVRGTFVYRIHVPEIVFLQYLCNGILHRSQIVCEYRFVPYLEDM